MRTMNWKTTGILLFFLWIIVIGKANADFRNVSQESGIAIQNEGRGVAIADYNRDGNYDIFVLAQGQNLLFRNDGGDSWHFTEVGQTLPILHDSTASPRGTAFIDYNNDGFPDLLYYNPLRLLKNTGDGNFVDVTREANLKTSGEVVACAAGDYDRDGYLDLYLVFGDQNYQNMLLKNSGAPNFQFIDRGSIAKVNARSKCTGAIFFDYNQDNFPDIYLINNNSSNYLYENQQDGTFKNVASQKSLALSANFTGIIAGDYNNDGNIDLYLTASGAPNRLMRNNGAPEYYFTNVANDAGVARISNGFTSHFGDYDNDGWLDIYLCSSFQADVLYKNNQDGTFQNVAEVENLTDQSGETGAFFDYNNDGALDIFALNTSGKNQLYENSGNENNWLKIQLLGENSNRDVLGARILMKSGGSWQMREVNGATPGAFNFHILPEHFGLAANSQIDSLLVIWPNGDTLKLTDLTSNRLLVIHESEQPPLPPLILEPANNSFINNPQPIFKWLPVADPNQDSLHFRIDIADDADFVTIRWQFDSWLDPAGFMPEFPVVSAEDTIHFKFSFNIPDGVYFWRVREYDGISLSSGSQPAQVTIDYTAPLLFTKINELNGTPANKWQNLANEPIFALEGATDNLAGLTGYYYYWGTDAKGEADSFRINPDSQDTLAFSAITSGVYYLRIRMQDQATNLSPWKTAFVLKYDDIPPTGALAQSVAVSDTEIFYINWESTATDAGGSNLTNHYYVRVQVTNEENSWWLPEDLDVIGTGLFYTGQHGRTYGFEVAARDSAGNVEPFTGIPEAVTYIDTLSIDTYPPLAPRNLTATGASTRLWQNQPQFLLSWRNLYDRSGIKRAFYKLGTAPVSNFDTTGTAELFSNSEIIVNATQEDGQWCFLWLRDGRGNLSANRRDSVLLRYDKTPPEIERLVFKNPDFGENWFNPNKSSTLQLDLFYMEPRVETLKLIVNQLDTVIEETNIPQHIQPFPISLSIADWLDGAQTLEIFISDSAGNSEQEEFTLFIDKTPPSGTVAFSPAISNRESFKVSWYGSGNDNISGSGLSGLYDVRFRENEGFWQTWLSDYSGQTAIFTGNQGSRYDFEVAAYDLVGNLEIFQDLAESSTLVDTTQQLSAVPPEKTIQLNPVNHAITNQASPELRWRVPIDGNADRLHFKVEIALDSLFTSNLITYESNLNVTGFTPMPPVPSDSGEVHFKVPDNFVDSTYWWRVSAWDGQFYGEKSQAWSLRIDTRPPANPLFCSDTTGAQNNLWQNLWDNPFFTWENSYDNSGIAGYWIYWGMDSTGIGEHFTKLNQFPSGPIESGKRYLRVRTQDLAGNLADEWKTLFIFKYDNLPPIETYANGPALSNGSSFRIDWKPTSTDPGGSGLTGFYDIWVEKDYSGIWLPYLEKYQGDTLRYTGEIGHYYGFEVAAWDSAGNREIQQKIAECRTLCAPKNHPPEAPVLLSPVNGLFIDLARESFTWEVPADFENNRLHFKIEFSRDSLFTQPVLSFESKTELTGFSIQDAVPADSGNVKFKLADSLPDGAFWWRVSAWDGWIYGTPSLPFKFLLDTKPPEIFYVPRTKTRLGEVISINFAAVDSGSGVDENSIAIRIGGVQDTVFYKMMQSPFIISSEHITLRGLEYALISKDRMGNQTWIPENSFVNISVETQSDGLAYPVSLPFGKETTKYRMISIPLILDQPALPAVLEDDLGQYDLKKWRLFLYHHKQFFEYENIKDGFLPGKAYWFITRNEAKNIDTGVGKTVPINTPFKIMIDSTTWTMIGNPFNFPISPENLTLESGEPLVNLITYHDFWQLKPDIAQVAPWEGYMIKCAKPTTLIINPTRQSKNIVKKENLKDCWEMKISATCADLQDPSNYIGVKSDAAEEWDQNDLYEPPIISDFVAVRFPHLDWKERAEFYATDFRPQSSEGHSWDFEVQTSQENQPVKLEFNMLDSLPDGFGIHLIDLKFHTIQSLKEKKNITFASGMNQYTHPFRLIVGTDSFIQDHRAGVRDLPDSFELYANFPNPFNSHTLIQYFLPEADRVNLTIYNMLGQRVKTLIRGEALEGGFYEYFWDGSNEAGESVASGIYFYHFNCEKAHFSRIRKMVLVR
ncbi:VCBS repeat-containing protein [candidate division KSB1 bacterium]|nr:VCBS repeat-containing protein [candidate division KSB1 bacterium]